MLLSFGYFLCSCGVVGVSILWRRHPVVQTDISRYSIGMSSGYTEEGPGLLCGAKGSLQGLYIGEQNSDNSFVSRGGHIKDDLPADHRCKNKKFDWRHQGDKDGGDEEPQCNPQGVGQKIELHAQHLHYYSERS